MTRPRRPPATLRSVGLLWYSLALLPILAIAGAGVFGWLAPLVAVPLVLFLLFFWLFSFGFAIYARLRKPKDLRQ